QGRQQGVRRRARGDRARHAVPPARGPTWPIWPTRRRRAVRVRLRRGSGARRLRRSRRAAAKALAMTAGSRRSGRAYALQLLYARDGDPATDVAGAAASWAEAFELELDPAAQAFARELVAAASQHAVQIDALIGAASKNWRIDRMSRVDRNILRLGACEPVAVPHVPRKVGIHEAGGLAQPLGHRRVVRVRQRRARPDRDRGRPAPPGRGLTSWRSRSSRSIWRAGTRPRATRWCSRCSRTIARCAAPPGSPTGGCAAGCRAWPGP